MPDFLLPLARDETRAFGKVDFDLDGLYELLVGGGLRYVRREVSGVLDDELDAPKPVREFFGI